MSEKKVGKRLLTWVLVLVMTLSLLPLNVLAASPAVMRIVRPDTDKYITYNFYLTNEEEAEPYNSQIIKTGDTLLEPEVTVQNGKRLTGWYTENDTLFDGFGEYTEAIEKNSTVNLYAKFEDVYYVFFKDTTDRIVATKEGVTDAEIKFDDVSFPVESDESIIGWYLESDSDKTAVTSVTLESTNVTLCAIVEKGHWITFDSKGGSNVEPQFVRSGESCAAPSAPTKPGYDFDGWYDGDIEFSFGDTLGSNKDLTAHWTAKNEVNYTVIHWLENANNDDYSYKESERLTGTAGELTEDAVDNSYEGFTLDKVEQKEIAGDGSTIVNVYYKRNMYTVTFVSDGRGNDIICGKEAHEHTYTDYKWGLFSGYKYKGGCYPSDHYSRNPVCGKEKHSHNRDCYGNLLKEFTITAKHGANISNKWPTYNGSNTWKTSKNGDTYQVNIDTMPLGGATFYGPKTGNGSETAYYYVEVLPGESGTVVKDGVTYKLHRSDTTQGTGYSVTDEDKYPITGFTFKDFKATWINGSFLSNGYYKYDNAEFYYTRNSYNIVYMSNGVQAKKESYKFGASIVDAGDYKLTTPPAGKEGYVFVGWYADPAGEQEYVFTGKTMPAQNITVYAKWKAPTFTVTVYDVNKETKLKTFENVPLRGTISKDVMPTGDVTLANGDTFLGWTYEDGTPFNFNTAITKNIDLYARVGNQTGYSVKYVVDPSITAQKTVDAQKYANNSKATVLNNLDPLPANKVFLGWTTTKNGTTVNYYPNSSIEITGNVTLYAVYGDKAATVTLTYNANFGTTPASTQISDLKNNGLIDLLSYDELVEKNQLPKRDGYTFTGWNTKQDGHGISFAAGTSAARVDKVEPNVLYAQWKKTTIDEEVIVTIKGKTSTATYDGTEKSVTGYTVERSDNRYTENDFTFTGTATATGTDAGTYQMVLKPADFENKNANFSKVTFVVTDGSLTITKRDVTLTSASASKPYDGTALTSKNVTVGGNGFADGEGATYNVTGSQTEVGESANAFTYTLNSNTKESNYNITKHEGKLKITAADSVAYKVEHYKQNLDGSYNKTPDDIDLLSGTAGTHTAAAAKGYPGFTPGTVTQEKIKSDGTTTIRIQYTRNSYTLTINYVYRDGSKAAESHIETILYGKDYSVTSPKISGYTADKLVVSGTMPADNRTVTVTYTKNGGHHPRPKPTVVIPDDDALGLNTTDHFAYIVGYGNGEVRPQNNITRAEVATIFFRLLTDDVRDENLTKTNRYSDVTRADWYNTAVSTLSSMGIITGYPDGTFRPNAAITRAEFAAIAARFDSNGDKTTAKFSDIANHWAKDEISIAYNNGWITGYPDGTFGPQRDITRAETMTLVNRVLNRQPETEDDLLPNMTVWTDNANPNAWYYLAVQEATNSHYYKFKTNSKYEKWTELRETRDWTQLEK